MPSPVSQMLPIAAGRVRLFLHRTAFFWRGAAAIAGAVFVALLIVAFTVPKVYQSEAVILYAPPAGAAATPDDVAIGDRLHAALLDPRTLERVARGLTPEPANANTAPPNELVERVRQSIELRPRGDQKFAISLRASSAAYAQHGCQELAQLAVQHLEPVATASSPAAEDTAKRAKALEEKTRELAAFVAAHPEVAMNRAADGTKVQGATSAEPPGNTRRGAETDTALVVLQQERAKLEARLAEAEKQKEASTRSEGNPYDPPVEDDAESLRQMITQVKAAIAARQGAVAQARRDDSTSGAEKKSTVGAAAASSSPQFHAEWQRLVQALLEAQREPPKVEASPSLRIVQAASFPSAPIKPNRLILALVGLTSGLWMGVLWAFSRVALGHDLPRAPNEDAPLPAPAPVAAAAAVAAAPVAAAAAPVAEPAALRTKSAAPLDERAAPAIEVATPVEAIVEDRPASRQATPSSPPTKETFWRPPLRLRVTQRGVVDLAAILAHTGTAAASTMPTGVDASPIVGVGDGSDTTPEAAGPPPRGPSDRPPPQEVIPTRSEPAPRRRPTPLPNAQTLVGHLGPELQANDRGREIPSNEARPRSDAPPRAPSDPPARPRSDPPVRPRSDPPVRAHGDPPVRARSDPPAQARSDPPARPRSDPQQQRVDAAAIDGAIEVRDVPTGWSPDPSIAGSDSVDELRAIREQLYRFAVRGCFVVGVTSSPDAVEGKSRMAARLASALAEPQRARVLLMEGDFDGPAVHRLMRIEMPLAAGFSEQVRRRMKGPKPAPWAIVRCSPSLQVLAEGRVRAPGLLSTVQFMEGISELRRYYDVIVLDGPAAGSVDARILDEISDGLVIVGANEAAMPELRRQASQWFSKKGWLATLPAKAGGG